MPTYYARKSGNINATDVWATTPTGTTSNLFPTFTNADVLVANSFTITVNVSTTVAEVRNDTTGGATVGGSFALGAGVLLKANVIGGNASSANSAGCVSASVSASIEGNVTVSVGGFASSALVRGVSFSGVPGATLTITGNIIVPSGLQNVRVVDFQGAGGTLSVTGNFIGNSTSGTYSIPLSTSQASNTGSISITGNITAGNYNGFDNLSNNVSVTVTGTVTGGNSGVFGILNSGTSTITAGMATGGVGGAGVSNASTGTIRLTRAVGNAYGPGNTVGLAAAVGAANSGLGILEIQQLEYGTYGMSPTSGTGIRLKKLGTNVAVFNYCDTAGAKTLIDATQNAAMPAATDVRLGVSYASGAATGSCAVPDAGSVALGVPVDNTTGTAILTQANVQSALTAQGLTSARAGNLDNLDTTISSRLAPSGTLARVTLTDTVTTLTNAPTVPSPSAIASQVRTELGTELGRLDASVSSRLASASYQAPSTPPTAAEITTAVWAAADKTGYSLSSTERSAIASALEGSLLNEADGQAVLNAIVGAIGNQNLSEVSLVAAIRADIERNGGKLDSIPTTAAPTAAQNATAVWSAATRSVTGGTVDTLTNAPASVTPSDIWSHATRTLTSASGPTAAEIRTEMDTNSTRLANLDASVSSRMAASEATKLDAVKAKTDALNIERLGNVATTNIVGTLLAQANS